MLKKILTVAAAAAVLSMTFAATAFAGSWEKGEDGWSYKNDDGSYQKNGWATINGASYYFDEDGYIYQDMFTPDGYYVDENGVYIPNYEAPDATDDDYKGEAVSAQAAPDANAYYVIYDDLDPANVEQGSYTNNDLNYAANADFKSTANNVVHASVPAIGLDADFYLDDNSTGTWSYYSGMGYELIWYPSGVYYLDAQQELYFGKMK